MNGQSIRTFLGANTPYGFCSFFEPFLRDTRAYVVKGGPGTGKSSIMKKVAAAAIGAGHFAEYIYCSSDPHSLDGILIPSANFAMADGTPPHMLEPPVPGASGGIFDTGRFWNEEKLCQSLSDIVALNRRLKECHSRSSHYLAAAGDGRRDLAETALRYLDTEKAEQFALRFAKRHIPKGRGQGRYFARFLSGFTPDGPVVFRDTLYTLCEQVYVIRDKYFLSDLLLKPIADYALANGYDVYLFYQPLAPDKLEHLAIPALSFAVATAGVIHGFVPQNGHSINMKRFFREDPSELNKQVVFARGLIRSCIKESGLFLAKAKRLHDDLEDYYIGAMDFKTMETEVNRLIATLHF